MALTGHFLRIQYTPSTQYLEGIVHSSEYTWAAHDDLQTPGANAIHPDAVTLSGGEEVPYVSPPPPPRPGPRHPRARLHAHEPVRVVRHAHGVAPTRQSGVDAAVPD